jgi:hypothetical protein
MDGELNANFLVSECSRLKDKGCLTTFLSCNFQIKTSMLRMKSFTRMEFSDFGLHTSNLDSSYLCTVILFSHISFSFLENIVAFVREV